MLFIHALRHISAAPWRIIFKKTVFLSQKKGFFRVKKQFFSDYYATGRKTQGLRLGYFIKGRRVYAYSAAGYTIIIYVKAVLPVKDDVLMP